jgi:hypothetical protein
VTILPIRSVRITHLIGQFDWRLATRPTHTFALYAQPINLLREACTCLATGSCDVCKAWAAARHRHEALLERINPR